MLKATLKRTRHGARTKIRGRRVSATEIAVMTVELIEEFAEIIGEKDMDKAVERIWTRLWKGFCMWQKSSKKTSAAR